MKSIETLFRKIIPDKYYDVQKHNLVGIFFVVLVILISQYPAEFRSSFNTVYGKLFILILIMILTNYNVVAGLTATIVVLALYIDLFKTGNEGFRGEDPNTMGSRKLLQRFHAGKVKAYTGYDFKKGFQQPLIRGSDDGMGDYMSHGKDAGYRIDAVLPEAHGFALHTDLKPGKTYQFGGDLRSWGKESGDQLREDAKRIEDARRGYNPA